MARVLRNLKLKRVSLCNEPVCQEGGDGAFVTLFKADLGTETRNDLPDSAFAAVWTDADGNKQRKLPFKHADGSIDKNHLRNALARIGQTDMPADLKGKARAKLEAAASNAGIGEKSMKKDNDGDADDMVKCKACKAMTDADAKFCKACGEPMNKEQKAMSLENITDPEVKKAVEKLQADLAAAQALLDDKAAVEKGKKSDDDVLKSLSPEARQIVEKAQSDAKAAKQAAEMATAAIEKMEGERLEKSCIEKAAALKHLSLKAEDFGPVLKRVRLGKTTEADEAEILRVLTAADGVAKAGKVFKSAGKPDVNGDPAGSAAEVALSKARALIEKAKADGGKVPSVTDAVTEVLKSDPELYLRHRAESTIQPGSQEDEE